MKHPSLCILCCFCSLISALEEVIGFGAALHSDAGMAQVEVARTKMLSSGRLVFQNRGFLYC